LAWCEEEERLEVCLYREGEASLVTISNQTKPMHITTPFTTEISAHWQKKGVRGGRRGAGMP